MQEGVNYDSHGPKKDAKFLEEVKNRKEDQEALEKLLGEAGVKKGDKIEVIDKYNVPHAGFYTDDHKTTSLIEFKKSKGQFDFGKDGLAIYLSIRPTGDPKLKDQITESNFVLVREIESIDKLITVTTARKIERTHMPLDPEAQRRWQSGFDKYKNSY